MKLNEREKRLIRQFNQAGTQLVISRWPSVVGSFDGIATYTIDTVTRFAGYQPGVKFVVLAEEAVKEARVKLVKKNVLVIRAFDSKRVHLFPQVLIWLGMLGKVKQVYVHSEFCASGGPVLRFLVVPFLALIRMAGCRITFYAHNVVKSLNGYEEHLGYKKGSMKMKVMELGYQWYFRLLALIVTKFVVLEEAVGLRLQELVGGSQVVVQPHWIAPVKKQLAKVKAKRKLGYIAESRLVVVFGFVTHYKGADLIAQLAKRLYEKGNKSKLQIVLAGGPAYSLQEKDYYQEYYEGIEKLAASLPNLRLTGFLKEEMVDKWLTAADVVVFPYRNLMGGSGALQKALAYGKAVLLSKPMVNGLSRGQLGRVLKDEQVEVKEISFEHKLGVLEQKLDRYFDDKDYQKRLNVLSRAYSDSLRVEQLLPVHYKEVYGQEEPVEQGWWSWIKPVFAWAQDK